MPPGKVGAQCVHASLGSLRHVEIKTQDLRKWKANGEPVIVLFCNGIDELREIIADVTKRKYPFASVYDAGKTCVACHTLTCVGIGPVKDVEFLKQYCLKL